MCAVSTYTTICLNTIRFCLVSIKSHDTYGRGCFPKIESYCMKPRAIDRGCENTYGCMVDLSAHLIQYWLQVFFRYHLSSYTFRITALAIISWFDYIPEPLCMMHNLLPQIGRFLSRSKSSALQNSINQPLITEVSLCERSYK